MQKYLPSTDVLLAVAFISGAFWQLVYFAQGGDVDKLIIAMLMFSIGYRFYEDSQH